MKLPGHIAKRVSAPLEEVAVDGALRPVSPAAAKNEAERLLPYFQGTRRKPQKKLRKELQSRRPAKAKAHKENTRALRAAALKRSGGRCEWCRMVAFSEFNPAHFHHTEGGSGRRREQQALSNVVMLCGFCHRGFHHNSASEFYRRLAVRHCQTYGYPVPVNPKGTARSAPESVNSLAIKDTQT